MVDTSNRELKLRKITSDTYGYTLLLSEKNEDVGTLLIEKAKNSKSKIILMYTNTLNSMIYKSEFEEDEILKKKSNNFFEDLEDIYFVHIPYLSVVIEESIDKKNANIRMSQYIDWKKSSKKFLEAK